MKKSLVCLIVAIVLLVLLPGCNSTTGTKIGTDSATSKMSTIPFQDNQLYAAAWVGYQEITQLSYYMNKYIDDSSIPTYYISNGDYYLIIPRYSDMHLKLYKIDTTTDALTLAFEESDCKPFLIQCNVSDVIPDATISLTYRDETIEFSPYISLKGDGVKIGERGLNLTKSK